MKSIIKSKFVQYVLATVRVLYFPLYLVVRKLFCFKIKSPLDTVEYLKKHHSSISRFGDGELNIIFKNKPIGFQEYDEDLKKDLLKVASGNKSLIALPSGLEKTMPFNQRVRSFWWSYSVRNCQNIRSLFDGDYVYLDTNFTRVVTELRDHEQADIIVNRTKELWSNRNVIIVEGIHTRFGVGNGLLNNCKKVYRILMPEKNAYYKKNEAILKVKKLGKTIDDPLILLALGPTATVLAYELSDYFQAVDIGHFDLQYEYKMFGNYKQIKVLSRYDNERAGGDKVSNINDKNYLSEVKYTIH